jgi:hypothetical protein
MKFLFVSIYYSEGISSEHMNKKPQRNDILFYLCQWSPKWGARDVPGARGKRINHVYLVQI